MAAKEDYSAIHSYTDCNLQDPPPSAKVEEAKEEEITVDDVQEEVATEHSEKRAATEHSTSNAEEDVLDPTYFSSYEYWDTEWYDGIDNIPKTKHSIGLNAVLQGIFSNVAPSSRYEWNENLRREDLSYRLDEEFHIWKSTVTSNLDAMIDNGVSRSDVLDNLTLESKMGRLKDHFLQFVENKVEAGELDLYLPNHSTTLEWTVSKLHKRAAMLDEIEEKNPTKLRRTGLVPKAPNFPPKAWLVPKISATNASSSSNSTALLQSSLQSSSSNSTARIW